MKVSIIIVNFDGTSHTRTAVASILRHAPQSEIIVVDNGSRDRTIDSLPAQFPGVSLLCLSENRGFSAGNNRGVEHATGDLLLFLNNDAWFIHDTPNTLGRLFESDPSIGILGPKLVNPDGSFQMSFGDDPSLLSEWRMRRIARRLAGGDPTIGRALDAQYRAATQVDWVTGAALMMRRTIFDRVGGFDESYFLYFEDIDLCRRVRDLGLRVVYAPTSRVVHLRGASGDRAPARVAREYRASQLRYYQKYHTARSQFLLRLYLLVRTRAPI